MIDYKMAIPSADICLGDPEVRNIFFCDSGNKRGSLEDSWAPSSLKQMTHFKRGEAQKLGQANEPKFSIGILNEQDFRVRFEDWYTNE